MTTTKVLVVLLYKGPEDIVYRYIVSVTMGLRLLQPQWKNIGISICICLNARKLYLYPD